MIIYVSACRHAVCSETVLDVLGNVSEKMKKGIELARSVAHLELCQDKITFQRRYVAIEFDEDELLDGKSSILAVAVSIYFAIVGLRVPSDLMITGSLNLKGTVIPVSF